MFTAQCHRESLQTNRILRIPALSLFLELKWKSTAHLQVTVAAFSESPVSAQENCRKVKVYPGFKDFSFLLSHLKPQTVCVLKHCHVFKKTTPPFFLTPQFLRELTQFCGFAIETLHARGQVCTVLWGSGISCSFLRSAKPCFTYSQKYFCHTQWMVQKLLFLQFCQINHSTLLHISCRTLGLVFQSENFNYNHYNNYIMDSWSYLNNPVPEPNHSKPRLNPEDNFAALTMLHEHCKVKGGRFGCPVNQTLSSLVPSLISCADLCFLLLFQNQKEQKVSAFSRTNNICKPVERWVHKQTLMGFKIVPL